MMAVGAVLGLTMPSLIVGAIFVETLFTWPGIGQYAIESTREHDYAAIMGVALLTSAAIVASNLITDVAYAFVDPRIRVR